MARIGNTLVFSFDGTGNEPADAEGFRQDESISNVLKLHLLLGGGIDPQPPEPAPAGAGRGRSTTTASAPVRTARTCRCSDASTRSAGG